MGFADIPGIVAVSSCRHHHICGIRHTPYLEEMMIWCVLKRVGRGFAICVGASIAMIGGCLVVMLSAEWAWQWLEYFIPQIRDLLRMSFLSGSAIVVIVLTLNGIRNAIRACRDCRNE